MLQRYSKWLGIGFVCIHSVAAQHSDYVLPRVPLNLDFTAGTEGAVPPYWELTQRFAKAGYSAELRRQGCPGNIGCLVLHAPSGATTTGLVVNEFDAQPYRNESFQVRARVKVESASANDRAGLWVRVIRSHGAPGFIDDTSNRTARSTDWQSVVVNGRVDADATAIIIGLSSRGEAQAWIDGVSFTVTSSDAPATGWLAPSSLPVNLDFREGLGAASSGWQVNPGNVDDGYVAEVRREGCHIAQQCAALIAPETPKRPHVTGNLIQVFDAGPYRGKALKVSAWLRAESVDRDAYSGLWLRVDDHIERFTTNEDPVRPGDWQRRELEARIDPDAKTILLGVSSFVARVTWVDSVSVDIDSSANSVPAPISLEFEESAPGKPPRGWTALAPTSPEHYSVQTTKSGCKMGPVCVVVSASPEVRPNALYNLMRTAETMSRTGHQFRLRAWVKLDAPSSNSTAQMWIRMDGRDRKPISYAIADSPAPGSGWILRELTGKVDSDAISIAFGFFSRGEGTMSVGNVSLEFFD